VPRGVGLDRQRVVDAASAIVHAEGADALTLAAVADSLGVRSPSLYKHVTSLDDLRWAVVADTWRALEAEVVDGATDLREVARVWRSHARAHPHLYLLASRTHREGPPEVQRVGSALVDRLVALLRPVVADEAEAIHAVRSVRALVHGFLILELSHGFGLDVPVELSFERGVDALLAGLAPG
jgi:AcrR family transcriptional regulator